MKKIKRFVPMILALTMLVPTAMPVTAEENAQATESVATVKLNGPHKNPKTGKWCYYKNGKIDKKYNSIAKIGKNWWKFTNGVIDKKYTGVAKRKENGKLYYLKKGKLNKKFTGIARIPKTKKYYLVKKGKVATSYTGLYKNPKNGKYYYIKKGRWQKTYSGKYTNTKNGKTYTLKNGVYKSKTSSSIATKTKKHNCKDHWWPFGGICEDTGENYVFYACDICGKARPDKKYYKNTFNPIKASSATIIKRLARAHSIVWKCDDDDRMDMPVCRITKDYRIEQTNIKFSALKAFSKKQVAAFNDYCKKYTRTIMDDKDKTVNNSFQKAQKIGIDYLKYPDLPYMWSIKSTMCAAGGQTFNVNSAAGDPLATMKSNPYFYRITPQDELDLYDRNDDGTYGFNHMSKEEYINYVRSYAGEDLYPDFKPWKESEFYMPTPKKFYAWK